MNYLSRAALVAKQPNKGKERVEFTAPADWVERVQIQAERLGLSVSAYIRLATTEKLERDEASEPNKG